MLEMLKDQLSQELSQLISNSVNPDGVPYYYMVPRAVKEKRSLEVFRATLRLRYSDIESLTREELYLFKSLFQEEVTRNLDLQGKYLETDSARWLEPNDPANYIDHEKDHIKVFPSRFRHDSEIHLVFTSKLPNEISLFGAAILPDHRFISYKDYALSFSEPKKLSKSDINGALQLASKTKDEDFIILIKQRILDRGYEITSID